MKILVLGASGMMGSAIFRVLSKESNLEVFGSLRDIKLKEFFKADEQKNLIICNDVLDQVELKNLLAKHQPDVVVNAIGLVKQIEAANDPLKIIPINSLLPHYLVKLCEDNSSRLIHVSTDCVFSGRKGNYVEEDFADARDLYGLSKFMGEVADSANAVTLRTSIIGHELNGAHSLIDWFLSQTGECLGFTKAIYSGLPTVCLANIIRDLVIPNNAMQGLYHVSSEPISKYDLLNLVAKIYGKKIDVIPDDQLVIDRSLCSTRFQKEFGYKPEPWESLVQQMHNYRLQNV